MSPEETHEDPFDGKSNDQGHPGSPPPQDQEKDIATELRKSFIDSVAKGASNLNREALGHVSLQPQHPGLSIETTTSKTSHQQAPYNPFARTLASIEGTHTSVSPPSTRVDQAEDPDERAGQGVNGPAKPAMDVDSFTRMLLTGAPAATVPSNTVAATPPLSVEGGSTESSSISRQSLSDQLQDAHPESPRSSYEDSRSDDAADADEYSGLVGSSQSKKAKPPPPAHRHGKPLSRKGPQTVSFADFESSLNPSSSYSQPSITQDPDLPRPRPGRSPSDLNKPLPPPPQSVSPDTASDLPEQGRISQPSRTLSQEDDQLQTKKIRPPPPPTSRRSSQMRVDGPTSRARSSSQLSKSSIPDDTEDGSQQLNSSASSVISKPPPPPSRRVVATTPSIGAESSSSTFQLPTDPTAPASLSKAPPPPPSRQALRGTPTLTRTPSTQSTSSIGKRRISPSLGGGTVPPPPPPRRGERGSSFDGTHLGPGSRRPSNSSQRSSIELRRSSGASLLHARAPSVSSLHDVPESEVGHDVAASETPTQGSGKDILADLSAFQAEIDALRAQIGK